MSRGASLVRVLIVAGLLFAPNRLLAQQPKADTSVVTAKPPQTISSSVGEFRRVYVPADRPQDWPTDGDRYLPIGEEEFARLLEDAQAGSDLAPGVLAARISGANYTARIDRNELLVGRAVLHVTHNSTQPALLSLEPWSAAIKSARWQANDEPRAGIVETGAPAILGNAEDGSLMLLVTRSGRLVIEWSLRGQRNLSGTIGFSLRLPQTASSEFVLDAPSTVSPELEHALATELPQPDANSRRWKFKTGGHLNGTLRLSTGETRGQRRELTLFRQSDVYEVTTQGIDLKSTLQIDAHGDPVAQLNLEVDPNLQIISIRKGDLELPWTVTANPQTKLTQASIKLPRPISGAGEALQIQSIAPLLLGEVATLPRLRCEGMFWQEGNILLRIKEPLVLDYLEAKNARQTGTSKATATDAGDAVDVQCFTPQASLELRVDRPENRRQLDCGTRLEFFTGEMVANLVADIRLLQGKQGSFSFPVGPLWQIDAVEAGGTAAIVDWDVEGSDPERRLVLRLAQPVTPTRPIRLKVTGRRVLSMNDAMSVHDLSLLRVASGRSCIQRILLQEPDTFDLQVSGEKSLNRIDIAKLGAVDPLYLDPAPRGIAFVLDGEAELLRITLAPRKPQFSAQIHASVDARGAALTEETRVRCQPSGVSMDRLLVHTSQDTTDSPWLWSAGKELGPVNARRLTVDEQLAAGAGSSGQAWEISWRVPQREAFEIRATRTIPWTKQTPLSLVGTPEASTQSGVLVVRSLEGTGLEIINQRLAAIPGTAESGKGFPTLRGTFRFDPSRDGFGQDSPVEIRPIEPATEETGAWAWNCELDSRYSKGGMASHLAVFRIQTQGQSNVNFRMPAGSALRGIWVDADRVDLPASSKEEAVSLRLPQNREYVSICLYFLTSESLPRIAGDYSPAFPTTDIPIFARRWRLWLPNGFDAPTTEMDAHRYSVRNVTWMQRVFGPLGRGLYAQTRNPLQSGFWQVGRISQQETVASRNLAQRVLARVGRNTAGVGATQRRTWGDVLEDVVKSEEQVELRISRASLAEANIQADTRLPESSEFNPVTRGAAMLSRANLALLVRDRHVLLVATPFVAVNHEVSHQLNDLPAYLIDDGPLAADMEANSELHQPIDFLTPQAWQLVSTEHGRLWTLPDIVINSLAETRGWKAYQFDFSDKSTARVTTQNTAAIQTMAAAILLAVFAAGVFRSTAQKHWWLALCLVSLALIFLLPVAWTILASAVFLGSLASGLFMARRPVRRLSEQVEKVSVARSSLATTASVLVLTIGLNWFASQAVAQEVQPGNLVLSGAVDSQPTQQHENKVAKVLVLIDDHQKRVGDQLYVSEAFYRRLLQNAASVRSVPRGWLITKARYRCSLNQDSLQQSKNTLQLRASFALQIFQRNSLVRIPLLGEGLHLAEGGILIDGRPTNAANVGAGGITVQIDEPGPRQLELTMNLDVQQFGTVVGFEVNVPSVADSQTELSGADTALIELPTIQGSLEVDKDRSRLVADLGESSQLIVRWPQGRGGAGSAPTFEIDELQWARVQPGSMIIDVRLNVRVLEGRVRELRLITDPRLRLISPTGKDAAISAARILPGDPQTVDVELTHPIVDQGVIKLRFVVAGASGVGNLRLPKCEVAGVRATRRWFAVSVDSGLEYKQVTGEDIQPLAIPEFAAAWGDAEARPQAAFRMSRAEVLWTLSTQPKAAVSSADDTLTMSVEPRSTSVRWQADVNTTSGFTLQRHIVVPRALEVESVSVTGPGNEEHARRWSRNSKDGTLTVLLDAPLAGQYRITVRGRIPHELHANIRVPEFSISDVDTIVRRLAVFRHPLVLVNLRTDGEWQRQAALPAEVNTTGNGSLVESLTTNEHGSTAELSILPNEPRTRATQVLTVNHDGNVWSADLDFRLKVQAGVVDAITLEVPGQWESPVLIEPIPAGVTIAVNKVPGVTTRQVVIRPAQPVEDEFRFVLRGVITESEGDRLRVPDLVPLGITRTESLVLLPKQVDLQSVTWDTSGLISTELPTDLDSGPVIRESHDIYQVIGERFQGSLRLVGQTTRPIVELAESQVRWDRDGRCHGVTSFALIPSGLQKLVVETPRSFVIVHCRVGGIPTRLSAIDAGRWSIPIAANQAPQMIELVFQGTLENFNPRSSEIRVSGPSSVGVEVVRTLWKIYGPTQASSGTTTSEIVRSSPARYQARRMDAALAVTKAGRQMVDVVDLGQDWAFASGNLARSTIQQSRVLELSHQDSAQAFAESVPKLRQLGELPDIHDKTAWTSAKDVGELLDFSIAERRPLWATIRSGSSSLKINSSAVLQHGTTARLSLAAGMLIAALAVLRWAPRQLPAISTAVLGFAVAAGWWAWMNPSLLAVVPLVFALISVNSSRRSASTNHLE